MPQTLPKDSNRDTIQLTPSAVALATTVSASISASTTITFNAETHFLRVYAIDKDIYLKWGTTTVTASNFDEVIPANQICDFWVPRDSSGTRYTGCKVIERSATATIIAIEK